MKQKIILIVLVTTIFSSCKNKPKSKTESDNFSQEKVLNIKPLEQLNQVDKLLAELVKKPQQFNAPSNKTTKIIGEKGTIIHLDPTRLETLDGSLLGSNIQVELLEMTDTKSLVLNNSQTVSNGEILVTGGAYYLNMKSDGKQLSIKKGKGLEVEFPKLTENKMSVFLGERDSIGQINWIETKRKFVAKKTSKIKKPKKPISNIEPSEIISVWEPSEDDNLTPPKKVDKNNVSSKKYNEYLKALKKYKKQKKQIEYKKKTYQAIELLNFGWINCDRFNDDKNPKTDIQLIVNNDSLKGARIYAVFKDMNSIISEVYIKGQKGTTAFKNIPIGKELKIIALSVKDETPYFFEKTINTKTDKKVQVNFEATTQVEIKEKMKKIN